MADSIERVTLPDGKTLEYDSAAEAWYEVTAQRTRVPTKRALRLLAALGLGLTIAAPASAAYTTAE